MTKARFRWTPERIAAARRLYVDEGCSRGAVAAAIGEGCPLKAVSYLAWREGWSRPRGARCDGFAWTTGRIALARRLYVLEGRGPTEVAAEIGGGCEATNVTYLCRREGWNRARRAPSDAFTWTPGAVDTLRRLFRDRLLSRAEIAARIGGGCTARAVGRKAHALGLSSEGRRAIKDPGAIERRRVSRARSAHRRRMTGGAGPRSRGRAEAFARRFLAAGWSVEDTAWVFDLPTDNVAVLAGAGRA